MSPKSPSPAYSLRLRVRLADRPGTLGALAVAIGEAGGNINALEGFELKTAYLTEDVIVYCADVAHQDRIRAAVERVEGVELLHCEDRTFALHDAGKITVDSSVEIRGMDDLAWLQAQHGAPPHDVPLLAIAPQQPPRRRGAGARGIEGREHRRRVGIVLRTVAQAGPPASSGQGQRRHSSTGAAGAGMADRSYGVRW